MQGRAITVAATTINAKVHPSKKTKKQNKNLGIGFPVVDAVFTLHPAVFTEKLLSRGQLAAVSHLFIRKLH